MNTYWFKLSYYVLYLYIYIYILETKLWLSIQQAISLGSAIRMRFLLGVAMLHLLAV